MRRKKKNTSLEHHHAETPHVGWLGKGLRGPIGVLEQKNFWGLVSVSSD